MSVNVYARQAPISDACGRADYISNANRQENLLATASTISMPDYWQLLSADSQAAFRQSGGRKTKEDGTPLRACEAREIHVQLPNSALERMQADELAQKIADDFRARYGVDCLVAIHYNGSKSNLHCHILYSERQLLQEPEIRVADRAAFLDSNGVRKRTKKEITDADEQLLPGCRIVKKGEVLSARYFGDKNPMFAEKSWLDEYKVDMAAWINENLQPDEQRTVYDQNGHYLAQKHIGKGPPATKRRALKEWNKWVKEFNGLVDVGLLTPEEAREFKLRISLSPNQNQELMAVVGELYREWQPDNELRPGWDAAAYRSAATPLAPTVERRQEKQELRELYKAHGEARAAVIDAPSLVDAAIKKADVTKIEKQIVQKKEQLGVTPEMRRVREIGRLAGVKRDEVDQIYRAAPRMTCEQWSAVWADCKEAKTQFWAEYQSRSQTLRIDIDDAYKRRRKVKQAEWLIDPRNRRKSLLGVLYAAVILSKHGSLRQLDREIDELKQAQTALRRDMQRFKAATTDAHDTLHTKGLEPDRYLASVHRLQRLADRVSQDFGQTRTEQHRRHEDYTR